jgi:hypothetical protein
VKNKTKVEKTSDDRKIIMQLNLDRKGGPCAFCGREHESRGFDFLDAETGNIVCDWCVDEVDVEQSNVMCDVMNFVKIQERGVAYEIRDRIQKILNKSSEKLILRHLDALCDKPLVLDL